MEVAAGYFRAGADKVSIGTDAVLAAEEYWESGGVASGTSTIEQIAQRYGSQAVVVSIDPRRAYVRDPADAPRDVRVVEAPQPGPDGEGFCWYQCTIRGGREGRPLCAFRLAEAVANLGAGELLVNCVDRDGQKNGFELPLLRGLRQAVGIPVIASSGAGAVEHFSEVFAATDVQAALAAGIFHRREVAIDDVKRHLTEAGVECRPVEELE